MSDLKRALEAETENARLRRVIKRLDAEIAAAKVGAVREFFADLRDGDAAAKATP
jgi:hypothetical protein